MPDIIAWTRGHAGVVARTLGEHVTLSLAALLIVLAVALPLGVAIARYRQTAVPIVATVNILRTIPSLALLVLMLPFLGTGFLPSVTALTLYGLPAVLINTHVGLTGVDPDVIDAARGQGLSRGQVLRQVTIPLALPVIFAGVRTAAVQIVSAATLAVFIGGGGLGELISSGMALLDIPQLLIGALLVAGLAVATEFLFGGAERLIVRQTDSA